VSKQKSCVSCARSKLKCSLDSPACERCLDRGTLCEYPAQSPYSLQQVADFDDSTSSYFYEASGASSLSPYAASTSSRSPSGSHHTSPYDQSLQWDPSMDSSSMYNTGVSTSLANYPIAYTSSSMSYPSSSMGNDYQSSIANGLANTHLYTTGPDSYGLDPVYSGNSTTYSQGYAQTQPAEYSNSYFPDTYGSSQPGYTSAAPSYPTAMYPANTVTSAAYQVSYSQPLAYAGTTSSSKARTASAVRPSGTQSAAHPPRRRT
jgi:hypothetical protein